MQTCPLEDLQTFSSEYKEALIAYGYESLVCTQGLPETGGHMKGYHPREGGNRWQTLPPPDMSARILVTR